MKLWLKTPQVVPDITPASRSVSVERSQVLLRNTLSHRAVQQAAWTHTHTHTHKHAHTVCNETMIATEVDCNFWEAFGFFLETEDMAGLSDVKQQKWDNVWFLGERQVYFCTGSVSNYSWLFSQEKRSFLKKDDCRQNITLTIWS